MFEIIGKVQSYAWGGKRFIPSILGVSNTDQRPFAEYWMGIHPSAPARIRFSKHATTGLPDLIRSQPIRYLGNKVAANFGDLPYLLKILDVREMLSIQVHPSREEAQNGFEMENAAGVPLDAPHRNYKDKNHKPEMMLALGEFWLLHGFRQERDMHHILEEVKELEFLLPIFKSHGYAGLYRLVMEKPQDEIQTILQPLADRILPLYQDHALSKDHPDFWAARAMLTYPGNFDRGIFSIYFFNLLHLHAGEAIFQGAGLPHAYLEGQNIELMSNSDNVLRAGLTPKHVDVPELMKHTRFEPIRPALLKPLHHGKEQRFLCPVEDFGLSRVVVSADQPYTYQTEGPEIILVIEGMGKTNGCDVRTGQSFFAAPGEHLHWEGSMVLIRAWVP